MHRLGRLLAVALIVGALPSTADAADLGPALTFPPPPAAAVPGELVVGFTDDAGAGARAAARSAVDGDLARRLGDRDVQLLDVPDATDLEAAAAALERRPGVAYAEPNYAGRIAAGPNDTRYAEQAALTRIAAEKAWDYTTGSTAVRVAILDTGIDRAHPDLSATGVQDVHGHGTKVAGIAAARGNNGAGIAGVAWRSDLRSYAACDAQGVCTTSAQVAAINAAKADGAKVANMSIDSTGVPASQAVRDALADSNMLVVAAAGNGTTAAGSGRDLDTSGNPSYPCSYALANVLCVGATRAVSDTAYQYTNYGATSVDLYAPGSGVLTTTAGGGYATSSGTSEAAPHVTGAAALLWAADPTATIGDVRNALEDTTDTIQGLPAAAHGRLNVFKALASVDVTAPVVTLTTAVSGTTATATFGASEPNVTFECRLDDGAWTTGCTSPRTFTGLTAGQHTIAVRATDPAGNQATATRTAGVRPTTTITSRPPAATQLSTAEIGWTVDEPTATSECRLDGGVYEPCTSPLPLADLPEGSHTVAVRAVGAGGTEAPARTVTWRVDTLAPVVSIASPTQPVVNTRDVDVVFDTTEPATYTCAVDDGDPAPCASPLKLRNLPDTPPGGEPYRVSVVATDAAGNTGPAAEVEWTVDATAPSVTVAGPSGVTADRDAAVTFTVGDGATETTCTLDGVAVEPCTSPLTFDGLADGAHAVVVRATAANGTVTSGVAAWTVDDTDPVLTLTSGPGPFAITPTSAFTWTVADASATTVTCAVDDGPAVPCASPWTTDAGLANGEHAVTITPRDVAGNAGTPVTRVWTKDTIRPAVALTGTNPSGAADRPVFTFESSSSDTVAFECSLDSTTVYTPCTSPRTYPRVEAGQHTFRVRAVDAAGNRTQTPATLPWTVTLTAPRPSITGPAGFHGSTSASFAFDAPGATAYECKLDNAAEWTTGCTSPADFTNLPQGPHTFQVRTADPNLSDASAQTFTVDTVAPSLMVTSAPEGTQPTGDATVAFTAEAGAAVTCRVDGGAATPCTSPLTLSGLGDGGHTVALRAADAAGNASTASVGWTVQLPVIPQPTPIPTAAPATAPTAAPTVAPTPEPTPSPVVTAASTSRLTSTVAKRFTKRSGPAAAKVRRFTVTYGATLPGKLAVRVELRVGKRYKLVGGGSATYTRAGDRKVGIAVSKAGAKLLRKAGAKPRLRVRATFTPSG